MTDDRRGATAPAAPFFSVVIPVYDRADVLQGAVSSVLGQTCQDFEIIVVDDGSHDDPARVVLAFDDPRISCLKQENRGGGAARNRGIDAAQGRFVALLDSDDRFEPHHLEAMRRLVEGREDILAYAPVIADRGNHVSVLKPLRAIRPGEHMATYLLCDRGFIPTMTIVVSTAIARRVRFPEDLRCAEDTDFAIRLYLQGCSFVMAAKPGAVWCDTAEQGRSSAGGRRNLAMIPWIESLRGRIPEQAYFGCYGWAIAKTVATTAPLRALRFYLTALRHGCYRAPVAAIVFLQVFLPDPLYRWIADTAIAWLGSLWRRRRRPGAAVALRGYERAPADGGPR
jgi:GT2 family glycosyltransferase